MKTLKLTLLCLFVATLSFAYVSTNEKEALIALYNSTKGDQWVNTWDLNSPIESWYGVTVEKDQVVALNLEFNNLQGNLPEELGNLINLKSINLGFNKITGSLPNSIVELRNLKSLELFMNNLEGNIPNKIGNLQNLEVLKLYSNSFSGEIPTTIEGLTQQYHTVIGSGGWDKAFMALTLFFFVSSLIPLTATN